MKRRVNVIGTFLLRFKLATFSHDNNKWVTVWGCVVSPAKLIAPCPLQIYWRQTLQFIQQPWL